MRSPGDGDLLLAVMLTDLGLSSMIFDHACHGVERYRNAYSFGKS
jgi:hypothetical protein